MRPEYASKLDGRQEARITELVRRLLKSLEADSDSQEIGVDGQPTPKRQYAKFLEQVFTARIVEQQRKRTMQRPEPSRLSESPSDERIPDTPVFDITDVQVPPDVKGADQYTLPANDPAFMQAWDMMESQQMAGNMNSLLGYTDNQLPSNFIFNGGEQSWFL